MIGGLALLASAAFAPPFPVSTNRMNVADGWEVTHYGVGGNCSVSKQGLTITRNDHNDTIDFQHVLRDSTGQQGYASLILNNVEAIRVGPYVFRLKKMFSKAEPSTSEIRSDDPRTSYRVSSSATTRYRDLGDLVPLMQRSKAATLWIKSELVPSGKTVVHVDLTGLSTALARCPTP